MSQGMGQPPGGFGPSGGGYGPPQAGAGWYKPPGTDPVPGPRSPSGSWSPTEAISFGLKAVFGDFVGVALPLAALMVAIGVVGGVIGGVFGFGQALLQQALASGGARDPTVQVGMNLGFNLVQQAINIVIQSFVMGGFIDFCLRVVRGSKPPFAIVFGGARYFLPMLVGSILMSLAVGFGMLLCVVPGIIVALGCAFWSFIIVDRGVTGIEALKASWELTKGQKGKLFVFGLLGVLVVLAGMLACCVGAVLVSWPLIGIASAYVYLKLNGEEPGLVVS